VKWDDQFVQQMADQYQLGLPRTPPAGRSGELLGRDVGSALEFQEYRPYVLGDDVRQLDWAAYARSDTLMVRLFREEISPRTEILLDVSASMASGTDETKSLLTLQLGGLMTLLAGRGGARPVLYLIHDEPVQVSGAEALDSLGRVQFTARRSLFDQLEEHRIPMKRRSVRIVISDFLFPHDPEALVRRLGSEASTLWLIQVLNRFEVDPDQLGGRRCIDIENGTHAEIVIDAAATSAYRRRLASLQAELRGACRRVHGLMATVVSDTGLIGVCRKELCSAGVLRAA
jgi:uncharacterized protein (DUF58 family)